MRDRGLLFDKGEKDEITTNLQRNDRIYGIAVPEKPGVAFGRDGSVFSGAAGGATLFRDSVRSIYRVSPAVGGRGDGLGARAVPSAASAVIYPVSGSAGV